MRPKVNSISLPLYIVEAVTQWVIAFASQAESWLFESQQQRTLVIKAVSDHSTGNRSATGVSVRGPPRK